MIKLATPEKYKRVVFRKAFKILHFHCLLIYILEDVTQVAATTEKAYVMVLLGSSCLVLHCSDVIRIYPH